MSPGDPGEQGKAAGKKCFIAQDAVTLELVFLHRVLVNGLALEPRMPSFKSRLSFLASP